MLLKIIILIILLLLFIILYTPLNYSEGITSSDTGSKDKFKQPTTYPILDEISKYQKQPVVTPITRPQPVVPLITQPQPVVPLITQPQPKPFVPLITQPQPKPFVPLITQPQPVVPLITQPQPQPGALLITQPQPVAPPITQPQPVSPPITQPQPVAPPITQPKETISKTEFSNAIELSILNNKEIIDINTNLSTLNERLKNLQQQQIKQQDQNSIYNKITDIAPYIPAIYTVAMKEQQLKEQKNEPSIVPFFNGIITDYPDYKYKDCWSYGNIPNGLDYPIASGGIYKNIKSMQDCVKMAATNNFDTATYDGSNLCLVGGGEYKTYTQFTCDNDIYGKKAWQVYSKI